MYAEFFGLRELPFNNTPDPRFFYSTPDHEEALASLIYAVKERKGFVLLTGEVGAGKTLVSRMMLRHFGPGIAFANINHAMQSAGDLMESLCSEFELPYEHEGGNAQLVRTLHDFLLAKFAQNAPVVLVLDEAQNLPIEAFEQLRMIGNLEADDAKLLQIAIVGQPELQRLFLSPQLRQLKQRIFRSYHLPALDRKSTEGYIRYRLSVAAAKDVAIFAAGAIDRIYAVSGGLPRLINTVCDNAMLSAYSADRRKIDDAFLESVLAQMMLGDDVRTPRPALPHVESPPRPQPPREVDPAVTGQPTERRAAVHHSSTTRREGHEPTQADRNAHARSSLPPQEHRSRTTTPSVLLQPGVRLGAVEAMAGRASEQGSVAGSGEAVAEVRSLHVALESMAGGAKTLLSRGRVLTSELQQREQRLVSLSQVVRKVAAELADLLSSIQRTSAESRREQMAAQQIHDHLAVQTQRARQTADELSRIMSRATARPVERAAPVLVKAASVPVAPAAVTRSNDSPSPGAIGLEEMLSSTRDSLSDLRRLARATQDGDGDLAKPEPHPAARLARQVDSLLELVGGPSGAGYGSDRRTAAT